MYAWIGRIVEAPCANYNVEVDAFVMPKVMPDVRKAVGREFPMIII
jgi:hypothetical protein